MGVPLPVRESSCEGFTGKDDYGSSRPTVPGARQGRVAVAEPVFSKSPPWTMSAAPRSGHGGSKSGHWCSLFCYSTGTLLSLLWLSTAIRLGSAIADFCDIEATVLRFCWK